ncbi:MAG: YdbH domain-containing protein [Candidatus Omnitrophica bacterium]|nr:YdbH domain-containing protein [Candidatus Omnitrophota bacterium]MDD5238142.1 YdbH domain-containing protein [Candidatus Omnitrophota bacterium]
MKRIIYILLSIALLVLITGILINPVISLLAKRQLRNIFSKSTVVIRECTFKPFHQLSLGGIEIRRRPFYDLKAKEIKIGFSIFSLFQGGITKLSLSQPQVTVDLPEDNLSEFAKLLNLNSEKRAFMINSLALSDLNLNLRFKDLQAKANISTELNLKEQLIGYLALSLEYLTTPQWHLKNASLNATQILPSDYLDIAQVQFGKIGIKKIKAKARLEEKNLHLDSLSADFLGGKIDGDMTFKTDTGFSYAANLNFINLDGDTFVNDLNLGEKFNLSGKLSGTLNVRGRAGEIEAINGDFNADEPGGVLTIKDEQYLKEIARNSNQSLEILLESFKNYHYNKGAMNLHLEGRDLVMDVALNGPSGKFNLKVIIHDFKLSE